MVAEPPPPLKPMLVVARDQSGHHGFYVSMILSENRFPLFGIML